MVGKKILVRSSGKCFEVVEFVPREESWDWKSGHYECVNILTKEKATVSQSDLQQHIRRNLWRVLG